MARLDRFSYVAYQYEVIKQLADVTKIHNATFDIIQTPRGESMLKKVLTFMFLACALTITACTGEKEEEATGTKAPAGPAATPEPIVTYGEGFAALEKDGDRTWRWMGPTSVALLKNTGKDMAIRFEADIPADRIKSPTITVTFNGEQLDQFTVAGAHIEKDYAILAAKQGSGTHSELRISTDKTFVPKELDPKSPDTRSLGLSLRKLTWDAK